MILTIILILILIFFFLRLLFSFVLRLFVRRMTGNTYKNQRRNQNVAYRKGETTIISHGEERSEVPKDFGDYTDYEEVKNER